MTAAQERLATARRALERAEAATGLQTRLAAAASSEPGANESRSSGPGANGPGSSGPGSNESRSSGPGATRSAASEPGLGGPRLVASRAGSLSSDRPAGAGDPAVGEEGYAAAAAVVGGVSDPAVGGSAASDHLPVPAALAGFFPPAGLRRGSVVQVGGSASLLLALLAAAQGEGWAALAALPDIGLQAAAEAGLSLERSLLVPRPGPEAASVVGALVDGVDVLAVGDCRALSSRDRRLLSARLRSRGAVLLSTAHWPGAGVVLRAGEARAGGLGQGWGQVRGGELTVHGRGRHGVAGRVRVRLGVDGLGADGLGLDGLGVDGLGAVPDVRTGAPAPAAPATAARPVTAGTEPARTRLQAVS